MNLLMIRHGEIPSNVKNIYAGKSAERLTDKGMLQAEQVARKLKSRDVHLIYSSPIQRALQTAKIIREELGLKLMVEPAFREMEMGLWEGLSESRVEEMYYEEWKIWQTMPADLNLPERETLGHILERVLTGVQNIKVDIADQNVVIVTHVAIIRVLLLWHAKKNLNLYKTIHVPNAEIFQIRIGSFHGR